MGGESIDWAIPSVFLGDTIVDSSANRAGYVFKLGIILIDPMCHWSNGRS